MRREALRKAALEAISEVGKTEYRSRVAEFRGMVAMLDSMSGEHPTVSGFVAREYEHVIENAKQAVESHKLRREMGFPEDGGWPSVDAGRIIKARLIEELLRDEIIEYAGIHGNGKVFIPHKQLEAVTTSRELVESGRYDLGLSVEPEGCAYAYFFEMQGMRVLHVFADFDGKGGIDYRETERLDPLRGKNVLIIEDDVQSGLTLRTVLGRIGRFGASSFGLYLGNLGGFQNTPAIPPQITRVHMNDTAGRAGSEKLEETLVAVLGGPLFAKYGVFGSVAAAPVR